MGWMSICAGKVQVHYSFSSSRGPFCVVGLWLFLCVCVSVRMSNKRIWIYSNSNKRMTEWMDEHKMNECPSGFLALFVFDILCLSFAAVFCRSCCCLGMNFYTIELNLFLFFALFDDIIRSFAPRAISSANSCWPLGFHKMLPTNWNITHINMLKTHSHFYYKRISKYCVDICILLGNLNI